MASILGNISSTLYDGDLKIIKNNLFKKLKAENILSCELLDVYTCIKKLEISFSDIDWMIENKLCIEIPRVISGGCLLADYKNEKYLKVSNLQYCKEFIENKELFCQKYFDNICYYDYCYNVRDTIDKTIMCCYISFCPEIELDYKDYQDTKCTSKIIASNDFIKISNDDIKKIMGDVSKWMTRTPSEPSENANFCKYTGIDTCLDTCIYHTCNP